MEHSWSWETRSIADRTPIDPKNRVDQWRLVCTCGHATCWRSVAYLVEREAARHALDGQQSLT